MTENEPHLVGYYLDDLVGGGTKEGAHCSCGAHWTFRKGLTQKQKEDITEAHIKYAKRVATKPD